MFKGEKFWAYAALISVCFFWGTTYFGIRIAIEDLPPFFLSGFRHILAGGILLSYFIFIKKEKIPPVAELKKIFIVGMLLIFISNTFLNMAEKHISTGLAALLCAFFPFYVLVINLIMKNNEPLNGFSGSGLLIGFHGLLIIFYDKLGDLANREYFTGIGLIVVGNLSWAIATVYSKKAQIRTPPLYSSGLQMFMTGVVILITSIFLGELPDVHFTKNSVWAVSYLIVFGSIVGFSSFTYAVSKLPTTVVSIYAYVNPIVAVALGVLFLGEKNSSLTYLAMVITFAGVFLINYGYQKSDLSKQARGKSN